MHPDSPIRELDALIRRYDVPYFKAVPFGGPSGNGYYVELGPGIEPITVGGRDFAAAIGAAFRKLAKRRGLPSFEELLERSSLGTPRAKSFRGRTPEAYAKAVVRRADDIKAGRPTVHWTTGMGNSACGRAGMGSELTTEDGKVTCLKCVRSLIMTSKA